MIKMLLMKCANSGVRLLCHCPVCKGYYEPWDIFISHATNLFSCHSEPRGSAGYQCFVSGSFDFSCLSYAGVRAGLSLSLSCQLRY